MSAVAVVLAASTGALGAIAFTTQHPHLVFAVLVPLLVAVERVGVRRSLWLGWVAGAVGIGSAFIWDADATVDFDSPVAAPAESNIFCQGSHKDIRNGAGGTSCAAPAGEVNARNNCFDTGVDKVGPADTTGSYGSATTCSCASY
jgi:hypothetical protein